MRKFRMHRYSLPFEKPQSGQAMVEFVIMLIIFMALCTGMIASMRLLTFQYWAQQEARFLAFEQTWVPHEFYNDSVTEPLADLGDGARFGRPEVVSDRQNARTVTDDGNVTGLLSSLPLSSGQETRRHQVIQDLSDTEAPVMFAKSERSKRPWWKTTTNEWIASNRKPFAVVDTAFASQDLQTGDVRNSVSPKLPLDEANEPQPIVPAQERLGNNITKLLRHKGFGPKICEALQGVAVKHQAPKAFGELLSGDCAGKFERDFGNHLAQTVDIRGIFQTYEENIKSGFSTGEALDSAVRQEVASGFYSFFDTLVSSMRPLAVAQILSDRLDTGGTFASSRFASLISDATYLGSNVALGVLTAAAADIGFDNPMSQSPQAALQTEQDVTDILHTDVEFAFLLSPTYLPIPPTFGAAAGGLQTGVMKNALFQSEDDDIRDSLIENSNKMVQVNYQAQGGLFPMATANIAGAEGANLTARFYLVTQPWHITRRNGTGAYRDKGTQEDEVSDETEEALLRRRVKGLWLLPHDTDILGDPVRAIPGLEFLGTVFDLLGPISNGVGKVIDFITDNPFLDFLNALADLPVLGGFIPTLPQWPAVRPDAYPGSTELSGSDPGDPDKMAGGDREFEDYIEEQRKFNPEPEPDYN